MFLATPYAMAYDKPVITTAVPDVYDASRAAMRRQWPGETVVLVLSLLLQIMLALRTAAIGAVPIGAIALILCSASRCGWPQRSRARSLQGGCRAILPSSLSEFRTK